LSGKETVNQISPALKLRVYYLYIPSTKERAASEAALFEKENRIGFIFSSAGIIQ
jgi:hypothetical protein